MITRDTLSARPRGSIVWAVDQGTYWRKGLRDTWHPIDGDGNRIIGGRVILSGHMPFLLGALADPAADTARRLGG